jgi:penicillin-binding protein 1C
VNREVEFVPSVDSPKREWFIRGTEPNAKDQKIGQFNQRIIYPPSGTVIALDPDIPSDLQKVLFLSQSSGGGLRWVLNGNALEGGGKTLSWLPKAGKYVLAISDEEGKVIDSVHFEVRGPRGMTH